MRRGARLRARSDRPGPAALRGWRDSQAEVARRRSRVCDGFQCRQFPEEAHHVFMRGNVISEPYASWSPMVAMLCRECHSLFHLDPACSHAEGIRWSALARAIGAMPTSVRWQPDTDAPAVDNARALERAMKQAGFDPREEIV